jgi:hypothetical protein
MIAATSMWMLCWSSSRVHGTRQFSAPFPVTAHWFNPAKDAPLAAHAIVLPNHAGRTLRTPGDNGTGANDWGLILEAPASPDQEAAEQ